MKKHSLILTAIMVAFVSSAFTTDERQPTDPYHFLFNNEWHEYDGNEACEPGEQSPCEVPNPLPGQSGLVQLYLSQDDDPGNRLFRD